MEIAFRNRTYGPGGLKIVKKPLVQTLVAALALNSPLYAQEAIEIEIDSAPVEIEIPQPAPPARTEEPGVQTAQTEPPQEEPSKAREYGVAIGIGALVAGALAALAGGGGGGSSSTTQHP
jgi:hypothetical protein